MGPAPSDLQPRPRHGKLSVVIAVCNEERALPALYQRLCLVLDATGLDWEILFVEDSSTDRTVAILRELGSRDARVRAVFLTRRFGHHLAITAGLDHVDGDHIVLMDGDLQHRPEDIPRLLEPYFEGFDVVFARRTTRQTPLKELGSQAINFIANRLSDAPIDLNSGMFRVISRRVRDQLGTMQERSRFLVGMISWLGYPSCDVAIDEDPRAYGTTKYSLTRMAELAVNYITSFSTRPLRLATYLGTLTAIASMLMGFYYLLRQLLFGIPASGWPTLIVTLSFLGGMILLVLGIMGEYIAKIYVDLQHRPLYVVRDTMNLSDDPRSNLRRP